MCENDVVSMLRGVGPSTTKKLQEESMRTVAGLTLHAPTPPSSHASSQWSMLLSKIPTLTGNVALIATDHRLASNLHQSLNGSLYEE